MSDNGLTATYEVAVATGALENQEHRIKVTGNDLSGNTIKTGGAEGVTLPESFTIDQVGPAFCAYSGCLPTYTIGTWEDSAITRYFVNKVDRENGTRIAVEFGVSEALGLAHQFERMGFYFPSVSSCCNPKNGIIFISSVTTDKNIDYLFKYISIGLKKYF